MSNNHSSSMHVITSSSLRAESPQDHSEVILKENPAEQTIPRVNVSHNRARDSSTSGREGGGGRQDGVIRRQRSRLLGKNINLPMGRFHSGVRSSSSRIQPEMNVPVLTPPIPKEAQGNRHGGNISTGSYPASQVDSTRPQKRTSSIYDWDWKMKPSSLLNLPVPNRENDRNWVQGHGHGIGTIGSSGSGTQTIPSLGALNPHFSSNGIQTTTASQEADNLQATMNQADVIPNGPNDMIMNGPSRITPLTAVDSVPVYPGFSDSLPEVESGLDEAQVQIFMEELRSCLETPKQMDPHSSRRNENDDGRALVNEGTKLDSEVERSFAGLIPFLMNDDFEDLIKWPDEQFLSYSDPYGFDDWLKNNSV